MRVSSLHLIIFLIYPVLNQMLLIYFVLTLLLMNCKRNEKLKLYCNEETRSIGWIDRLGWWIDRLGWWIDRLGWWIDRLGWWIDRLGWWIDRLGWWIDRL